MVRSEDEAVALSDVSFTYKLYGKKTHPALHEVNLSIKRGSFVGIIGRGGSGKSTLAAVIAGLEKPDKGDVCIYGYPGYLMQFPENQLFEETVIKDVMYGPQNRGWDLLKVQKQSFDALKMMGIGDELLDVSPFELSEGQKKRVAIAGVLAMKPDVLILDEPVGALDPSTGRFFLELLKKQQEEMGITVIMITHRMEDVAGYCERVLIMDEGRVVLDGSPAVIFEYEEELKKIGLDVPEYIGLMHALGLKPVTGKDGKPDYEKCMDIIAGIL